MKIHTNVLAIDLGLACNSVQAATATLAFTATLATWNL
jgi:hypothetical protein